MNSRFTLNRTGIPISFNVGMQSFLRNKVGLKKLKLVEVLQAGTEKVDSIMFETVSQTLENVTVLVFGLDFISTFSVETL